jgi:hypothetical protein
MWPTFGITRQALGQSHTITAKLDVIQNGQTVYTLTPNDGSVSASAGRAVMRNLGCTVSDPTGALSGSEVDDLLSPYDCEVAPYRGIVTTAGTEWVPLGIFGLTGREVTGDGQVTLTGQDRAMVYQGGMTKQLVIGENTSIENAIRKLLNTRKPGIHFYSWTSGYGCGPLIFQPDINVWAEAQKLAQSIGGFLYHDRKGRLHLAPLASTSTQIVARYAEGDGLLLAADRKEDSDTISNVVVVQNSNQQTSGDANTYISAVAQDTDPTSATYYRGRYGKRVKVITNQGITTVQQAQQAAAAQLVIELGRSETAHISIVPDPTLDLLDMVCVHRPRVGLTERTLVIEETTTPLTAKDPMDVKFRKYLLTEDGQTIETNLQVNT